MEENKYPRPYMAYMPNLSVTFSKIDFSEIGSKPCTVCKYYALRLGQKGYHFANNIFNCIFFNEYYCTLYHILLKSIPEGSSDNSTLVKVMAWCWTDDKPFPVAMLTQIYGARYSFTRPQCVNSLAPGGFDYSLKLVNFKLILTINI